MNLDQAKNNFKVLTHVYLKIPLNFAEAWVLSADGGMTATQIRKDEDILLLLSRWLKQGNSDV